MSYELYHHGILGQKWGVRRYQDKDGHYTEAGRRRRNSDDGPKTKDSKSVRLVSRDLDADRKSEQLYKDLEKAQSDLAKKHGRKDDYSWWYDSDGKLTQNAKKYWDESDKLDSDYRKKDDALRKQRDKEEIETVKEVFFKDPEIKKAVLEARDTHNQLSDLQSKTIGDDSNYANKAYKEYKEKHKDSDGDLDYAFYHYEWNEYSGNKHYQNALNEYKAASKQLTDKYNKQVSDIGLKLVGDMADVQIPKEYWGTYGEAATQKVNEIISWHDEYFK